MRLSACLAIGLAAAVVVLAGCGDADTPTEGQEGAEEALPEVETTAQEAAPSADLPEYTVAAEQDTTQAGQSVKTYAVFTDATSGEDFRALTSFFRSESPDVDAVVVSFYPNEPPGAELSGAGYTFSSEEAARVVLGTGYTDADIARIMQDDGLLVTSVADTPEEVTSAPE